MPEKANSASMTIRNGQGSTVKLVRMSDKEGQLSVNVADLPTGIYFYAFSIDGYEDYAGEFVITR